MRGAGGLAIRTKQLVAGAAIVGGAGLVVVGLGPMVVIADASPPIVSNEPDPSGPTFTIEPAPTRGSPRRAKELIEPPQAWGT